MLVLRVQRFAIIRQRITKHEIVNIVQIYINPIYIIILGYIHIIYVYEDV
jgi:hypothetical protein